MKKLFLSVLALFLFFCPLAVHAEEIAEALLPDQDEVYKYFQGEDTFQGTLSWQGNKLSSKFNYDKTTKKKRLIETH
tara:strand:+ start:52 stop:282 length:231 start_codon:yes stop_codon:yes gene_type:complete